MPSRSNRARPLAAPVALACTLGWAAFALSPTKAAAQPSPGEPPAAEQMVQDHAEHMDHSAHDPAAVDHMAHEQEEQDHEGHGGASPGGEEDPHAQHRAMMRQTGYQRSEHVYSLPDPKLVGMNGQATTLLAELNAGKPVMVNFIFTTCTTICPVMTGVFAQVQKELGPESGDVRMISISIDPQYDSPERLREYAKRFATGPQWQFLTGDPDDIIAVQKAFDVYRGNKMSHEPATLLRGSDKAPWVRLDGIASGSEIVAEYRTLVGH